MITLEKEHEKEIVLPDLHIEPVSARHTEFLPGLAKIYYQTWHTEGLCASLDEAQTKMAAFNPDNIYIVIDGSNKIYALVVTLPVKLPSLAHLPPVFPTYKSVETACSHRQISTDPNFVICFSVNALPGYRAQIASGKTQSLARFLLKGLPIPSQANQVAYSRIGATEGKTALDYYLDNLHEPQKLGAVGMHEHLGGITAAILTNSRPEDLAGGRANVIVVYPNGTEEAQSYASLKTARRMHPPPAIVTDNHCLFLDIAAISHQED